MCTYLEKLLPEETVVIKNETRCGKLNGNGNGMDFFSCTLIKSDLSLNELKQHYSKVAFKAAKKNKGHTVNVDVIPAEYKLVTEYLERENIYSDELKNMKDYSGYYFVMLYDGGYPANFDIRGN